MNENASENLQIRGRLSTADYALIALFAAVMAVCSWISIPATVPFTMQTFGVFLTVGLLGGKRGTLAILVYLLLGSIGAPVFSGFTGGIGHILGPTGGYMVGFILTALLMWLAEHLFGKSVPSLAVSMVLGLIVCYAFGTAWFMNVYTKSTGDIGLMTALGWCVFPYIIPDVIKIVLALLLTKRLRPFVDRKSI
ncbi:MAG: biotin transporter BioY [Mogibacterium sp.]|nr:biotin transporter BioY [Mogibacterium sp.]